MCVLPPLVSSCLEYRLRTCSAITSSTAKFVQMNGRAISLQHRSGNSLGLRVPGSTLRICQWQIKGGGGEAFLHPGHQKDPAHVFDPPLVQPMPLNSQSFLPNITLPLDYMDVGSQAHSRSRISTPEHNIQNLQLIRITYRV
jgi:hypothetical protein